MSATADKTADRRVRAVAQWKCAVGSDLGEGQHHLGDQSTNALASPNNGHRSVDAQRVSAVAAANRHRVRDVQSNPAVGGQSSPGAEVEPVSKRGTLPGGDFALALAAETLTDLERTRIALENRMRAMEQFHRTTDTPQYQWFAAIKIGIEEQEKAAELVLKRTLRQHPLGGWVRRTVGVGEKQGARLIAAIGDPYWNHLDDRPRRGPAELWAYCGYAPEQKRRKGVKSNWNAQAKMRAYLVAEACMKQRSSPYRADYDRARAAWADKDTTDGHRHNHALRVVAKAVLRDLFLEAKRVATDLDPGHSRRDYLTSAAGVESFPAEAADA